MYSFAQVRAVLTGKQHDQVAESALWVQYLLTDSRRIVFAPTSLFFALSGNNRQGTDYITQLIKAGCRLFVVPENYAIPVIEGAYFIQVPDVLKGLQQLAEWHRKHFEYPIIAITGSNGKTIVKEWLSQLLGRFVAVAKSPKSYNSQLGVALSLWELTERHQIGVFEAGISKKGEMQALANMLKPDIGIFTNIGPAHDEGFGSRLEKIAEKWLLMQDAKVVIYPSHYQDLDAYITQHKKSSQTIYAWHYEVLKPASGSRLPRIRLHINANHYDFLIPFADGASIENCLQAVVALLVLGYKGTQIQEGLRGLKPVSMRLEFKEGINDSYLIDDCYSNDLAGLAQALDFMLRQQAYAGTNARTVILSDILEAGVEPFELYKKVADLLESKEINRLVLIGEELYNHLGYFANFNHTSYLTTAEFLASNEADQFRQELILVKGARKFRFEDIVVHLQARVHGTRLEINLDAVAHNLAQYRSLLKPETRIMVMVKAFAYGSGSYEIANLLQHQGANYLAVAYTDEGVNLRENGISLPIMVMNPGAEAFEKLLDHNLEPAVFTRKGFEQLLNYCKAQADLGKRKGKTVKPVSIHIEVETGMNRLGFDENQLLAVLKLINEHADLLHVSGIFSHMAAADEATMEAFSREQIDKFNHLATIACQLLGYSPYKHLLNSPGITRFPEAQFDMVRLGIGLYGFDPNNLIQDRLQPVSRLKTTLSQVKTVYAGETVGYSRKGQISQPTRIGTMAIGYADGFDRRLSGGVGVVKVNGKRVPVIGNVCMDMTMVNLGNVPAKEGDEVIIFDHELTIQELAEKLGTIPYEILTKVSERVKRIFYTEQS